MRKDVLKLALEFVEANHSGGPDAFELITAIKQALAAPVQEPVATVQCVNGITIGYLEVMQAVGTKLYTTPPAQEIVCSTGLCHYKPAAPDLQTELDATNKQVEILSDALAESRREIAKLKELNT
jgi:hypothetical protein